MTGNNCVVLCAAAIALSLVSATGAATITFDFDTGVPVAAPGLNTPLDQTAGGVTATFRSPSDNIAPAFSVQSSSTTGYALTLLNGNYLWPNGVQRTTLEIAFDRLLTSISLAFATIEYHDPGGAPTELQLTAFLNSTTSAAVGSTITHGGAPGSDTYPQGDLSFDSGGEPFNLVQIVTLFAPEGATVFMADNIVVRTASDSPVVIPEPGSFILIGIGLLSVALPAGRSRRVRR